MKSIAQGGIVRALVALGLVSYQAAPALAGGDTANAGAQTQWVSQLIVKERAAPMALSNCNPQNQTGASCESTLRRCNAGLPPHSCP